MVSIQQTESEFPELLCMHLHCNNEHCRRLNLLAPLGLEVREHSDVNCGDNYWFAHEADERRVWTASEEMKRLTANLIFLVNGG